MLTHRLRPLPDRANKTLSLTILPLAVWRRQLMLNSLLRQPRAHLLRSVLTRIVRTEAGESVGNCVGAQGGLEMALRHDLKLLKLGHHIRLAVQHVHEDLIRELVHQKQIPHSTTRSHSRNSRRNVKVNPLQGTSSLAPRFVVVDDLVHLCQRACTTERTVVNVKGAAVRLRHGLRQVAIAPANVAAPGVHEIRKRQRPREGVRHHPPGLGDVPQKPRVYMGFRGSPWR